MQVRVFRSLITGVSRRDAEEATRPLTNVLQDRINYPIELQVEARGADLMEFGEKIDKGEIQIGAVWGIEYGWLHERFPKLEMMSHLSQHAGTQGWPVQIMVRNDYSRERITDLPVCRVARINGASLMDDLCLEKHVVDEGLDPAHFVKQVNCPTVRDAVHTVISGAADCIVLSAFNWDRYLGSHPNPKLKRIYTSTLFPDAVVFGRPDLVNKLGARRPRLWADLRRELLEVHKTAEGEEAISYWRSEAFIAPDAAYQALIQERVAEYPFGRIQFGAGRR